MRAMDGQNAAEEWMHSVDAKWKLTLQIPLHYPNTVEFDENIHVSSLLDGAMILRYHRVHVFVSERDDSPPQLGLACSRWEEMVQSVMFHGEHTVNETWRHEKKIFYQGIGNVFFMQVRPEWIGNGYSILESWADQINVPKKLLERAGLSKTYVEMLLHVFLAWMYSTFPGKKRLKVAWNHTYQDLIFTSSIPARVRRSAAVKSRGTI